VTLRKAAAAVRSDFITHRRSDVCCLSQSDAVGRFEVATVMPVSLLRLVGLLVQ
jgi:hypothetical protein